MSEDKVFVEQLDMFNKLILNLEKIKVKIDDKSSVSIVVCIT